MIGLLTENLILFSENSSFSQSSTSSPLGFDSEENEKYFPPLNDFKFFRSVNNDAYKNTIIYYPINQLLKSELTTIQHIRELERTQLLNILAMFIQNAQLPGYLLTGNRSILLYVGGFTV